jgi:glycosyltransferase involved in cell wall biosynthesis
MGAGRIVRHGQEGFVLDPFDAPGWVAAMQSLAEDANLRGRMGASAKQRAQLFCWENVARRRKEELLRRLLT